MKFQKDVSNLPRRMFARQAFGTVAVVVCFSIMMMLILGVTHVVQGQSTPDSLTYAESFSDDGEGESAERPSGPARMAINMNPVWRTNFGAQSAIALRHPSEEMKALTLQNLIFFATNYSDELDLSDTVPALLDIYEWHTNEQIRTMALAALHAIGDEVGMEHVLKLFANPYFRHQRISPRLRHITHVALADYLQTRGR